jgi:tRNA C32,U32 (ribose-2'-O)-methylase TrmJ
VLNRVFSELLDEITYAPHKKAKTRIMFRKIVARSGLSTWEFHTLAGVFTRATKSVRRLKDNMK